MVTPSGVDNSQVNYVLSISALYYVQAAGDEECNDLSESTKESFIKYANLTYLKFRTDTTRGKTRFIIIGI